MESRHGGSSRMVTSLLPTRAYPFSLSDDELSRIETWVFNDRLVTRFASGFDGLLRPSPPPPAPHLATRFLLVFRIHLPSFFFHDSFESLLPSSISLLRRLIPTFSIQISPNFYIPPLFFSSENGKIEITFVLVSRMQLGTSRLFASHPPGTHTSTFRFLSSSKHFQNLVRLAGHMKYRLGKRFDDQGIDQGISLSNLFSSGYGQYSYLFESTREINAG